MRRVGWLILAGMLTIARAAEIPPEAAAAFARGNGLKKVGQLAPAATELGRAVALAPDYADAWWVLGWVQIGLHQDAAAGDSFRQALRLMNPDDARRAKAERLLTKYAPAPMPVRVPRLPPEPAPGPLDGLLGWPLRLLAALVALCLLAALVALRGDWLSHAGSPSARFARLCERVVAGDRRAAGRLLSQVGRRELDYLPLADWATVLARAARDHSEVRQRLTDVVREGEPRRRRVAAEALARQEMQPEPALWTPLLDVEDPDLRRFALEAMSRAPDPDAFERLQLIARRDAEPAAILAVQALAQLSAGDIAPALLELARRAASPAARRAAAMALTKRPDLPVEVTTQVGELLDDPDSEGRELLVRALANGGEAAEPRLVLALLDADPPVRETAAAYLARRDPEPSRPARVELLTAALAARPKGLTAEALALLGRWDSTAVLPVVDHLLAQPHDESAPGELRAAAIRWLAETPLPAAAGVLRSALRAVPPHRLEPGAREQLGLLCRAAVQRGAVESLVPLLERAALGLDEPEVGSAASTLAAAADSGEALAESAEHPAAKVRRLAAALLAEFPRPAAADALLAEISRTGSRHADPTALADAALALGRLRDGRALAPLRAVRERHPEHWTDRGEVALALLGDVAATAAVEAMLVRESWPARRPAADYFRDQPSLPPRAKTVVAEAAANRQAEAILETELTPAESLRALGKVVLPTLQEWLLSPDRRPVAAEALAAMGQDASLAERLDEIDRALQDGDEARLREAAGDPEPLVRDYLRAELGEDAWRRLAEPAEPLG